MEKLSPKGMESMLDTMDMMPDTNEDDVMTVVEKPRVSFLQRFLAFVDLIRLFCGVIVENLFFQYTILVMIVVNSLMMAISTYEFVYGNEGLSELFEQADLTFLIIFTVELILQFIYRGFSLFLDGWLVFDFSTIVASWSFQGFQVIRAFRIFRALRLITRIKILKNLVLALGSVLPSMGAIMMLLGLILYIFAVMFTSLFKEYELSECYFDTLVNSGFTLFQMLTLDWIEITRELLAVVPWAKYPILVFIMFSGFIVYNLFVAVLCNAIYSLKDDEEDEESILKDEDGPRLQREIIELTKRIEMVQKDHEKVKAKVKELSLTLVYLENNQ